MTAERQSPDAIISSTGLDTSGGISVIQDDPDSPDANWFTSTATNGDLRVSFPTPSGDPTTGADVQEFRVQLRKDSTGGGTPTFDAELRETGGSTALETLATNTNVTAADPGTVFSLTWDAANLGTADGSAVELLLTFSKGGGGPNERNVEVGAVEWNVEYSAPNTIVNMDLASFTLTGQTATLTMQRVLDMDAGALTLTGQDATVDVTTPVEMALGSITLSGQDISLSFARNLAMDAGTLTLSGQDLNLTAQRQISIDAGSLTFTGQDLSLTRNVAVSADAGSFTFSGFDATITRQVAVEMDPGSLTFTGLDASVALSVGGAGVSFVNRPLMGLLSGSRYG